MRLTLAGGLMALGLAMPLQAQELDEARVKELVLETIRENPEIVMEALTELQAREQQAQADAAAAILGEHRALLEEGAPVSGNPEGDVTVIEFFDYNCPYCKRAAGEVAALIEADPNVRVIYREWPILGEGSVFAARAALAAREQDAYDAFHNAMMEFPGRADEDTVMTVAELVGLDLDQLREDMKDPAIAEHIAGSMEFTRALGLSGTPSFVIGDALVPGYVDADELQRMVDEAREDG